MASVNKVILVGNIGRDPEVRNTQSGDKIVNFSLATSESWKDKASGERKEKTEWHRVVIFNERLAEFAGQYLKKGSRVYVEGQIQSRKYEKDGADHFVTEIVISRFKGEIVLLDTREKQERPDPYKPDNTPARSHGGGKDFDDSIPFNVPWQ